jgi:hypothetical protein
MGHDKSAVLAARDVYVRTFIDARAKSVNAQFDKVKANVEYAIDQNAQRVKGVDAQLQSIADPTGSLAQALLYDREQAGTQSVNLARQKSALDSAMERPDAGITVNTPTPITASRVWVTRALPSASLGVILALILLYFLAVSDRKVRSRADMASLVGADVLGVLATDASEGAMTRVASLVAARAEATGLHQAVLVTSSNDASLVDSAHRIAAAGGSGIPVVVASESSDNGEILSVSGPIVIVASAGVTTMDSLEMLGRDLTLSGRVVIGTILVNIAPSQLSYALGSDRRRSRFY